MAREKRAAEKGGFWSRAKVAAPARSAPPDDLSYISAEVATLAHVFSGEYRFRLTCFQRAYSWRTPQVTRLLSNIREAMTQAPPRRRYCLGRLMLARPLESAETELVDGHQRLMTLTLLFAVLRDLEVDEPRRAWLHSFIASGGMQSRSKPVYRLTAQSTPSLFFESLVQEPGATERILESEFHELSETERNIYDNRETIRAELTSPGMDDESRRAFADFLADGCHVITVVVEDQDQAWELVHIEQETRLEFTEADQAKAILLSAMPATDRVVCSRMWEGCEAHLSASDMHRLLVHIGAMRWRCRVQSSTPIENDIVQHFALEAGGFAFMDQEFVPNAERLGAIRRGGVGSEGRQRAAIATSIDYMNWIDPHLWVTAALKWLGARGEADAETELFFRRLDRLVWLMKIAGDDPGVQETRMFDLCDEIAKWHKVDSMSRLQIEGRMLNAALANLRSPNFAVKHYAGLVLRRLSILLGEDSGPITRDKVTMEHVLPRNPPLHGEWRRLYRTEADVKEFAQRLGNITLLTGPQNQKAGTFDWAAKRAVLAASDFVLSRRASAETDWVSRTVQRRTEELIALLLRDWDLKP
ncbi:MAG: DUF262 domain-containing protein [Hyphomicrobium sp.]